jgi:hypothetical protein
MNKARRKELVDLVRELRSAKDKDDIYSVINTLENIRDDEESYYDNIPENLQSSQRAYDSENAIDNMNTALDLLNDIYDSDDNIEWKNMLPNIVEKINSARF